MATPESCWVLAGSALGSAFYWLPLAVSMMSMGSVESLQNRYLVQSTIDIPAPFLSVSVEGMVMLVGLITIVLGARRSALLLSLGALLAAAYVWFVLGYVAILIDQPVLSFRTIILIEAILGAAAGIGALVAVRWLRLRLSGAVVTGFVGFSAVLLVCTSLAGIPYLAEQRDASLPTGMVQAFDRATRGLGDGSVVLTDEAALLAVRPVHLFNVWNAHYSHPVGQFQSRSRFLARLAAERDPAVVAAALRHNRYDPVDVVMLDRSAHGLSYRDYQDNFPRGTRARTLTFHRQQFADRWFTMTGSTGRAVFVVRGADPLPSLDATQRSKLRRHFRGDLGDQV